MITSRQDTIIVELPSLPPSRNLHEAKFKSIKLFRRSCQLIPNILKYHLLEETITPEDAMDNLMKAFYSKRHLRNLDEIDSVVLDGYHFLYDAQYKNSDVLHFIHLILPDKFRKNIWPKNNINEEKNNTRTKFAKSFYS